MALVFRVLGLRDGGVGALQLGALFRSLQLEDVQPVVYRVTVRWFVVAVAVMMVGVLLAAFESVLA